MSASVMKLLLLALMATAVFSRAAKPQAKTTPRDKNFLDLMVQNIVELSEKVPQFKAIMDEHDAFFRDVYEKDGKEFMPDDLVEDVRPDNVDLDQCGSQPPSVSKPTSAHRVRPADIDLIGAVGDSLTAANGAKSWTLLTVIREYRGVSAPIGSGKRWDKVITTASMIREINDDLYGYSTGTGKVDNEGVARFNLAEPGNEAWDMPRQATNLVNRMKNDPTVDINNDWKLITLFIGGNDLCNYCTDRSFYQPTEYVNYIQEALDIFHQELPRTIVNVMPLFDMAQLTDLSNNIGCGMVHMFVCPCKPKTPEDEAEIQEWSFAYADGLQELVDSGRYDTNEDFTVVAQPFLRDTTPPLKDNGEYDYSYWAPDCFHFSEKSHKVAGQALWNNMIQPIGAKTEHWMLDEPVQCTTQEQPYIATRLNSGDGEWFPRE